MKDQVDKHLDKLAKRVFEGSALESPSYNFVDHVMSQVKELARNKATVYQPLISKKVWILILIVLTALVLWVIFNGNTKEDIGILNQMNIGNYSFSDALNVFSGFKLSETFIYAIIFFGVMISFQISILKRYYDQRFR